MNAHQRRIEARAFPYKPGTQWRYQHPSTKQGEIIVTVLRRWDRTNDVKIRTETGHDFYVSHKKLKPL